MVSASTTRAKNRLLRDLKEIENNPLETVYAQPLPNDIFHWYATVLAPKESRYHGIILNLSIVFPETYPKDPPKVVCSTRIHHHHVFPTWICLDMLRTHYSSEPYSGWSSSYSCLSILLQLQSFLLEEEEQQKDYIKEDIAASRDYSNLKIGHDPSKGNIWPRAPHWNLDEIIKSEYDPSLQTKKKDETQYEKGVVDMDLEEFIEKETKQASSVMSKKKRKKMNRLQRSKKEECDENLPSSSTSTITHQAPVQLNKIEKMKDLPNETLVHILSYLSLIDLKRVSNSSNFMKLLCENKSLTTERELICFHSKVTYKEDILGVGLTFETKDGGVVASISTPLDLVSKSAFFDESVRKSVWGVLTQQWIPIYINKEHGNFEALKQAVKSIAKSYPSLSQSNKFDSPEIYIDLLCKLMNTMVVEIMKGQTHASIKALYGYMYFHRWLIYLVQKFPSALKDIEEQVKSFVTNENSRKKSNCPNIGEFLPKLSVLGPSGLTWDYVKSSVVEETSIRNQLWVIKQFPSLSSTNDSSDDFRCTNSWVANNVSCKQLCSMYSS